MSRIAATGRREESNLNITTRTKSGSFVYELGAIHGATAQTLDATRLISTSIVDNGGSLVRDYDLYEVFSDGHGLFDTTQLGVVSMVEPARHLLQYNSLAMPMSTQSIDKVKAYSNLRTVYDRPDPNTISLKGSFMEGGRKNLFPVHPLWEENAPGTFSFPRAPVHSDLIVVSDSTTSECPMLEPPVPLSSQYATAEMWDTYRATIKKLYLDENRTLKDIILIMKENYGFRATVKMYKTRFNEWKLYKYFRAAEKKASVRRIEAPQSLGVDQGQPVVNGKIVKKHLIERHYKERRANHQGATPTPRPPSTSCRRISFSRIKDPTEYRHMECVLSQVNLYYSAKLEQDPHAAWASWKRSSKMPGGSIQVAFTFQSNHYTCQFTHAAMVFERYISATRYLKDGKHRAAWRQIHEGAEMVLPCLRQEFPNFLGFILYFFMNSDMNDYGDLRDHLLALICKMAVIVYGKSHPITRVCHLLHGLPNNSDIAALAQKRLLDTFTNYLGDSPDMALDVSAIICRQLVEQDRYEDAERSAACLITTSERHFRRNDYQTRHRLYDLALLYCRAGRQFEADTILADALMRGAEFGQTDYINILASELHGLIHGDRGDYEAAISLYWTALSGSLLDTGPRTAWTSTTIWMEYQKTRKEQHAEEQAIT